MEAMLLEARRNDPNDLWNDNVDTSSLISRLSGRSGLDPRSGSPWNALNIEIFEAMREAFTDEDGAYSPNTAHPIMDLWDDKLGQMFKWVDQYKVWKEENPHPAAEPEEEEEEEVEEEEEDTEEDRGGSEEGSGDSVVRRIQRIVYGREEGRQIDGIMGRDTRRKFRQYVRDNWASDHGANEMKFAIIGKGWQTASAYFNNATGLNLGSGNQGMLDFLEWMMQDEPSPQAEQGHVPGDARREMRSGREERLTTVTRGERGEDDLEVTVGGEEETLEDYTRRREKVHILVPASGQAMSIPGFTREIARIKIVFHDRGSLRDSLRDRNIKKVKVNRRVFRVAQQRKLNAIKDMVLNGTLVANYQGEDEGRE
jgi:hypothetical protein